MDLILFYVGFLALPVLGSLMAAELLWFAASVACFWAGAPRRTPSFTTTLLGASIVVSGALLYDTYCREADQYSFAIRSQPVIEGFRHGVRPILPLDTPAAPRLPPLRVL